MSYGPPPGNPGPPPPPGGGYGPPTGGYGPPGGGYGPPSGGYGSMQPQPSGPPKNYLGFNIAGIFGCTIVGIIGLIFALQVSSKWQMGDYAGAESAANTARILGIIGVVALCIQAVIWIFYILVVVVFASSGAMYY